MKNENIKDRKRLVVAYVRVSTKDQKRGYSPEGQKIAISQYMKSFDLEIDVYYEEAKSAWKEGVQREEFEIMINQIKANKIKTIVVWKCDRLTRNNMKTEQLLELMIKHNVTIISVTEGGIIDLNTADGRKNFRLKGIDNQHSSDVTSERTRMGQRMSAISGNYPYGHIPVGYKKKYEMKSSAIIPIDDETKKIINTVYDKLIETKWGIAKLTLWLNENKILGVKWYDNKTRRLLQDPIYIGVLNMPLHNPRDVFEDFCEPIINKEKFKHVQDIIHGKWNDTKYVYPLKGVIYCDVCGNLLKPVPTTKPSKVYKYYYCECCKKRISENKLISHVMLVALRKIKESDISVLFNDFNKVLDNLNRKIKYYEDLFDEGSVSFEVFSSKTKKYYKQIYEVEDEIKGLLKKGMRNYSDLSKRQLIKDRIKRITVNLEDREIHIVTIEDELFNLYF